MYRERHAHECATNNRSIMADAIDKQIETILTSVELQPGWRDRIAQLVVADHNGPDPVDLKERKRRLSRAYANMAFSDAEYETKLREIEASLRLTEQVELPTLEEAAQLFRDIPQLWKEATPEEQRKLLSPLLERVYVDMESGRIGAIAPAPGFRRLLEGAMTPSPESHVLLLSEDESDRMDVWSWWRRGRVELLAHPPWRTHSVTFPKPWGSSPTLLTVIHVHSALSCLMAEGHELGTRKLAQS